MPSWNAIYELLCAQRQEEHEEISIANIKCTVYIRMWRRFKWTNESEKEKQTETEKK